MLCALLLAENEPIGFIQIACFMSVIPIGFVTFAVLSVYSKMALDAVINRWTARSINVIMKEHISL